MPLCGMNSGVLVDPFNLKPEDIRIEDIAWGLSGINRYYGQLDFSYSVAMHSLAVAAACDDPGNIIHALLHDATEVYLGDIAGPLKKHFYIRESTGEMNPYSYYEDKALEAIYRGLGLEPISEMPHEVHLWDKAALVDEMTQMMPNCRHAFPWEGLNMDMTVMHEWDREAVATEFEDCLTLAIRAQENPCAEPLLVKRLQEIFNV